jgi:hypothetical protein
MEIHSNQSDSSNTDFLIKVKKRAQSTSSSYWLTIAVSYGPLCEQENDPVSGDRISSSRDQASAVVNDYIEAYYNHERIHQTLDYQTPASVELAFCMLTQVSEKPEVPQLSST